MRCALITPNLSKETSAFQQSCPRTDALRARMPQFFSAVKGAPERHVRVAKPHDSTSALRHEADIRPKGHCGPSACKKKHVFAQPEPAFALKSVRTRGLFEFRPTFQRDIEKSRSNQVETANLTDAEGMTLEIVGRSRDILSPRTTFWCFDWTGAQFRWADAQ